MLGFWRRWRPPKLPAQFLAPSAVFLIPQDLCLLGLGQQEPHPAGGTGCFVLLKVSSVCRGDTGTARRERAAPSPSPSPSPRRIPSPTSLPQDLTVLGGHLGTPGRCHLPPGPPRRGWDGSRTCNFSENSFSFSRVTQISAAWPCFLPAWPSHTPRLELPAGEAAKPGSVCSNEHGADGCCCTVLPQNRGHRENRAK